MREVLSTIGKNTPCPLCQAKIPLHNIKIKEIYDSSCMIDFFCPKCQEQFSGQAILQKINPAKDVLNQSSIVMKESDIHKEISPNESQSVHHVLEKDISFSDLFRTQK